jgi:hypothetical protein
VCELVADCDALAAEDEEAAGVRERDGARGVGEQVAVLAQLVADGLGGLARLVDREDATARLLGQLLDDLRRLELLAAERARSGIWRA